MGPIPAASIARWCEGLDPDETEEFRYCIRTMDEAYLEFHDPKEQERRNRPKLTPEDFEKIA